MFCKLSLLALVAPLVAGLTLNIPTNPISGETVTISWTASASDPVFSLELSNEIFHNSFAIANNVQPTAGSITLQLPVVPIGAGYTLEAVDIGNINNVYDTTGSFSVASNPSTTASSVSVTGSGTATGTAVSSGVSVTPHSTLSTSAFGTTVTGPASSATGAVTKSATGSGTGSTTGAAAASSSSTAFNGAATLKMNGHVSALAAVAISAVAGAAVFAL